MSSTTTLIMAFAFPLIGFAQTSTSTYTKNKLPQNKARTEQSFQVTPIKETPAFILELVSSNAVSKTITVHTYKYLVANHTTQQIVDSQTVEPVSKDISDIIDLFVNVKGVIRCTFDNATQSFTILSEPQTDLNPTVNSINKK